MKKLFLILILFSTIFASEILLTQKEKEWLKNHPNITLGSADNWPPFSFLDKDGNRIGVDSDYIKLLNKKLGTNIKVISGKWDNIVKKAQNKEIDGLTLSAMHKEKKEIFNFTIPYFKHNKALYLKNNSPKVNSLNDLKDKRIVTLKGNQFNTKLAQKIPNVKIIFANSFYEAIKYVIEDKADGLIGSMLIVDYFMKKDYLSGIKPYYIFDDKIDVVFSIRKDYEILVEILNKVIEAVSEEEKLKLSQKWMGLDVKEEEFNLTPNEKEFLKKHPKIRVGIDIAWPPFEYIDTDGIYKGLAAEYIAIIEKRLGVKFEIEKTLNWDEVVNSMKKRELDIYSCVVNTPQRAEYMNFTTPYLSFPMVIITSDKINFIKNLKELQNKKIVVVKGYVTHDLFSKNHPELKLTLVKNVEEGLNLISYNKAFAFIGNIATASYFIKKLGLTNLQITGETPYEFKLCMASRNDWPELQTILQKALNSISNEKREEIYQKWIQVKYEHEFDYMLLWKILTIVFIIIAIIIYWNRVLSMEVTKRKEAEARFKMLSDVAFEGIIISKDGVILDINRAISEIIEYEKSEMVGKKSIEFIEPKYRDLVSKYIKENSEDKYEIYAITKSGKSIPIEVRARVIKQNSKLLRVTAIRDISASKELEKNLREFNEKLSLQVEVELQNRLKLQREKEAQEQLLIQQSKMASMGEMIGAIAHQWRQPLNALSLIIQGVKIKYKRGYLNEDEINEIVNKSKKQINFMSQTIDDFRNFFKPDNKKIKFNIMREIKDTYKILDSQFTHRDIHFEISGDEIDLISYPNEFKQVILNILNNAKDAISEQNIENGFIKILVKLNNKIIIEIADNGGGIKEEIMEKIFQPYISTKGDKGTGIGLSISKTIIEEKLNGKIYVQNIEYENGEIGAKFTIEL